MEAFVEQKNIDSIVIKIKAKTQMSPVGRNPRLYPKHIQLKQNLSNYDKVWPNGDLALASNLKRTIIVMNVSKSSYL